MGRVFYAGGKVGMEAPSALPPVGTPLNDCTWEEIRRISDAGVASEYFSVGDTKTITINGAVGVQTFSNLSVDVFIIGVDHNSAREGAGRIHFQIGKIGGTNVALCGNVYGQSASAVGNFTMNTSATNAGGWKSSHMRKTVLGGDSVPTNPTGNTLLAALPVNLRSVMKTVNKYSDNTGGGKNTASYVTATTDYLWLLSEFELQGARTYANSAEQNFQAQYDYYKAGNSKVKYKHNAMTTAAIRWVRSVWSDGADAFCLTDTDGSPGCLGAEKSFVIAPAFAV